MKVLSVASEVYPLIKTGGLADVAGALPAALSAHGVDMRVLLPGYQQVMAKLRNPVPLIRFDDLLGVTVDDGDLASVAQGDGEEVVNVQIVLWLGRAVFRLDKDGP